MATKLAHQIDPDNQVGCMLAANAPYPRTCKPKDIWKARQVENQSYFFIDVQVRGDYPPFILKKLERKGITLPFEEGDRELLKQQTVDFVGFS
ncbi:family 1 glycosylhydrolase [Paenibacillus sp. M-152]|uniref:family 1 glycosylhydrolase n=1 Tax=Paenibacillus sp. M-152 TaxID=2487928 RepID=UPI00320478B2